MAVNSLSNEIRINYRGQGGKIAIPLGFRNFALGCRDRSGNAGFILIFIHFKVLLFC
jgi:hypothetical protein